MSNQPKKMVWDSCLDEPSSSAAVKLKSITNPKYQRNLDVVRQLIEKNNRRYIEARKKIATLVIKDSAIEGAFSDVLDYIDFDSFPKWMDYSEEVLKATLRSSMTRIPAPGLQVKEVYLSSVKKAKSVKLHNIIFNLSECLDILSTSYLTESNIFNSQLLSYIFAVIIFIRDTIDLVTIELSEIEAVIISCLYSFKTPSTLEDIYTRLDNSNLLEKYQLSEINQLEDHLKRLEDLKVIAHDGDYYDLIETVYI